MDGAESYHQMVAGDLQCCMGCFQSSIAPSSDLILPHVPQYLDWTVAYQQPPWEVRGCHSQSRVAVMSTMKMQKFLELTAIRIVDVAAICDWLWHL